jgi:hypothetical protein
MLARLKHRQIEKRVTTAQMSVSRLAEPGGGLYGAAQQQGHEEGSAQQRTWARQCTAASSRDK